MRRVGESTAGSAVGLRRESASELAARPTPVRRRAVAASGVGAERRVHSPSFARAMRWAVVTGLMLAARPAAAQGPHGKLSADVDCATCHSSEDWKVNLRTVAFDHSRVARFQLEGRHRDAQCRSCHLSLRFDEPRVESGECAFCHADVHQGAFAQPCAQCHVPTAFTDVPAHQIHSRTSFPLTGAHAGLSCQACHVDERAGAFAALDPACLNCHQPDYAAAQPVDHQAAGFPTDCLQCHSTLAWTHRVRFDHAGSSGGFSLVGAHARIRCASCHTDGVRGSLFQPAGQNDCVACHTPDYQRAHPGNSFPETCLGCHNQDTWTGATFDHALTGFPLVGAHQRLACAACHDPGTMAPRWQPANQNDCVTCHDADYQREHGSSGFPTTCLDCHTVQSWEGATFNHAALTGFALVGAHTSLTCTGCHLPGSSALRWRTPTGQNDCVACHDADYQQQHAGSGFPTTCLSCHTVQSWGGATFNHTQFFPITSGPHANRQCQECHNQGNNYSLFTCLTCHTRTKTDSQHQGRQGYQYQSNACLSCHPNGRAG